MMKRKSVEQKSTSLAWLLRVARLALVGLLALSACSAITNRPGSIEPSTHTPLPPTATATLAPTSTATLTPTPTPTAIPTEVVTGYLAWNIPGLETKDLTTSAGGGTIVTDILKEAGLTPVAEAGTLIARYLETEGADHFILPRLDEMGYFKEDGSLGRDVTPGTECACREGWTPAIGHGIFLFRSIG